MLRRSDNVDRSNDSSEWLLLGRKALANARRWQLLCGGCPMIADILSILGIIALAFVAAWAEQKYVRTGRGPWRK